MSSVASRTSTDPLVSGVHHQTLASLVERRSLRHLSIRPSDLPSNSQDGLESGLRHCLVSRPTIALRRGSCWQPDESTQSRPSETLWLDSTCLPSAQGSLRDVLFRVFVTYDGTVGVGGRSRPYELLVVSQ
ncbi:hypothetical protein BD309DRAFT_194038 [Dichomitus squalens]|nr:hypothetical protein BD309DRAFT_194038 [Dichomitus squalens]